MHKCDSEFGMVLSNMKHMPPHRCVQAMMEMAHAEILYMYMDNDAYGVEESIISYRVEWGWGCCGRDRFGLHLNTAHSPYSTWDRCG